MTYIVYINGMCVDAIFPIFAPPAHTHATRDSGSALVTRERNTNQSQSIKQNPQPKRQKEPHTSTRERSHIPAPPHGLQTLRRDQSINQRSSQSHTHGQRRGHIPAPPQGAANPASRSDAGLGG